MIEIKNLSKYYSNSGVTTLGLHDINLSFEKNEIVGIVGESGSGKSTLLNVISGMDSYDDGEIYYNGEETSYFDERDRDEFRKKNVAFINQNYNIIDSYSVLDNVTLPLIINGMDEASAKQKAKALIEKVHLSHRIRSKGSQLSGGEKQRCVIARALAKDTPILACDEPTGNLDSKSGEDVINLLKEVSEDKLVLIVTHNEEQANPILTRKIKIHDGQVTEDIQMAPHHKSSAEDEALVLEPKKNKSLKWIMAKKNLKGTPKKNIFTTLVFIAFSFSLMFTYLLAAQSSVESSFYSSSNFNNLTHERMVVYREDHEALDTSKLSGISGEKYENAFYEDTQKALVEGHSNSIYGGYVVMSYHLPKNAKDEIVEKNIDPSKNNITLVQNKNEMYFSRDELGKDKFICDFNNYTGDILELGGVHISKMAFCSDLKTPLIVFEKGKGEQFIDQTMIGNYTLKSINASAGVTVEEASPNTVVYTRMKTVGLGGDGENVPYTKNTIVHTGSAHKDKPTSVTLGLGSLYTLDVTSFDYKENIVDDYAGDQFTYYSVNVPSFDKCYELTIYADDMNAAKKVVEDAGYKYVVPSQASSAKSQMMNIKRIITTMLFVMITCLAFLLSFAVFGILSRVYVTKTKDFTIFRSLGVLKKDLRGVINIEINVLAFIASMISIAALVILSFFEDNFAQLLEEANVWMFIFFVAVIQLIATFIASRFNRTLFKLTITDSLKEERR